MRTIRTPKRRKAFRRSSMLEPVLEIGVGDYSPFSHVG
jgi:hypothetical protein